MDTRHIPGLDLSGFFIPGANGLPDLYVNSTDPAGWAQMQIAARNPIKPSDIPVSAEATAAAAETQIPAWMKAIEDVLIKRTGVSFSDYLHGFAISAGMILLAVALIILGAYQFTKD